MLPAIKERFKTNYLKHILLYLGIMVLIWIGVVIYAKMTMTPQQMVHTFAPTLGKGNVTHNFLPLFFWNESGALLTIALGLIPLPIYWFYIWTNAYSVGLVISVIGNPFTTFVLGILPHGIFEIPAQLIAAAISARLAWYGMNRFFRRKKQDLQYGELIKQTATDTLVIVTPLLFVAAIVETYITPIFIHMLIH
jgi:stage II sporulation protein M